MPARATTEFLISIGSNDLKICITCSTSSAILFCPKTISTWCLLYLSATCLAYARSGAFPPNPAASEYSGRSILAKMLLSSPPESSSASAWFLSTLSVSSLVSCSQSCNIKQNPSFDNYYYYYYYYYYC